MSQRGGETSSARRRASSILIYLAALLGTALVLSLLSVSNPGAGWLRIGTLLMAVGLAMWLPGSIAAPAAVLLSLASAYLDGGVARGVLRNESLLAVPGVALIAFLAASLRLQVEALARLGAGAPDEVALPPPESMANGGRDFERDATTTRRSPAVDAPAAHFSAPPPPARPGALPALPSPALSIPPAFATALTADLLRLQTGLREAQALIRSSERARTRTTAA